MIAYLVWWLRNRHLFDACDRCGTSVKRHVKVYGRIHPITRVRYFCESCGHRADQWHR